MDTRPCRVARTGDQGPARVRVSGLKDEYSESDLEGALVFHLEHFLLELGNDFAFLARQKRLRVGDEWYSPHSQTNFCALFSFFFKQFRETGKFSPSGSSPPPATLPPGVELCPKTHLTNSVKPRAATVRARADPKPPTAA